MDTQSTIMTRAIDEFVNIELITEENQVLRSEKEKHLMHLLLLQSQEDGNDNGFVSFGSWNNYIV